MKRPLVAVAAALALATPALAALPQVHARAYMVEDGETGQVLAKYHQRARVPIASLTKLMTVLLTVERTKPSGVVTVAPAAAGVGESSIDLHPGDRLTVRELLEGALIQSANDAADALAYYVGKGSEARFVAMMNTRARQLGLSDTHYARPDGLDAPGHVSSARDVTKLARLLMHRPIVRSIVRMQRATIAGGRVLHTWNDLLGTFPGVFGVKTGHTKAAGWNEVASVDRGGAVVYGTILGAPDRATRNADLTALLRWALSRYRRIPVLTPGQVYAKVKVGYGRSPVGLVPAQGLVRSVRIDQPIVQRVVASAAAPLPVLRGERLGEIRVYQGPRLLARKPLLAGRTVRRPGALGRAGFYARRTFDHMWGWVP
ncbi:MAG: D-alanyl-D-alanine carboxypeptidase [Actinobacteria bacterium]|nr:MAG: D-alanyl-D-alanine carboxypeptidase [Actinomycetota bacterium]